MWKKNHLLWCYSKSLQTLFTQRIFRSERYLLPYLILGDWPKMRAVSFRTPNSSLTRAVLMVFCGFIKVRKPQVFSTGIRVCYDINMYSQVDFHFQENWWITKVPSQFIDVYYLLPKWSEIVIHQFIAIGETEATQDTMNLSCGFIIPFFFSFFW